MDASGRPGLKVRRGLGTTDDAEADRLVAEMNQLLADERYWSVAARSLAETSFSPVIVDAFYSGLELPAFSPAQLREESIPLPGRDDGFARVLFVGTTGAGKTTLLRHLIGSDPETDRFPSTATGRTTTADIEVIATAGKYQGVVTFLAERAVRSKVEECVNEAVLASWNGANPEEVSRRLLQHPDQTFRLSYTLGAWDAEGDDDEEGWGFDDDTGTSEAEEGIPTEFRRRENQRFLETLVDRIRALAHAAGENVADGLEIDWTSLRGADLDAAETMLVEEAQGLQDYRAIIDEIMAAVLARFDAIQSGELVRSTTGWPLKWNHTSESRQDFLAQIRWFSSNYAARFGTLLTPVVQGIRVRGPFFPQFIDDQPQLVLIDGQGLGHTAESVGSVTTHITSRFAEVDAILLVDNAQQPMQAAPLAAVRAIAVSGHQDKLIIAFTHFDLVKGPNLRNARAKREHVLAAVRTALMQLRNEIGESAVRSIDQELDERCFTLGWMDASTGKLLHDAPKIVEELHKLLDAIRKTTTPATASSLTPVYDPASLLFALQAATRDFQRRWSARLGLASMEGERREHWTRIKALNRRIADRWDVEYDTLRPVADLYALLTEEISRFLEQPVSWEGAGSEVDEERARAIDSVRRSVAAVVHKLAMKRLIDDHVAQWVVAYAHSGSGSTFVRAQEIRDIYEEAAPVPGVVVGAGTKEFLDSVRKLIHDAIAAGGGKMLYDVPLPGSGSKQSLEVRCD